MYNITINHSAQSRTFSCNVFVSLSTYDFFHSSITKYQIAYHTHTSHNNPKTACTRTANRVFHWILGRPHEIIRSPFYKCHSIKTYWIIYIPVRQPAVQRQHQDISEIAQRSDAGQLPFVLRTGNVELGNRYMLIRLDHRQTYKYIYKNGIKSHAQ